MKSANNFRIMRPLEKRTVCKAFGTIDLTTRGMIKISLDSVEKDKVIDAWHELKAKNGTF